MGIGQRIRNTFLDCDQFASPYLLRFNDNQNYPTHTGATVSVIQYLIYIYLFVTMVNQTIQHQSIIFTVDTHQYHDPRPLKSKFSPEDGFMFAVGIEHLNLTEEYKYLNIAFNLVRQYEEIINSTRIKRNNVTSIRLVPCSLDHWRGKSINFEVQYSRIGLNSWLCPQINKTVELMGKQTSSSQQFGEIVISKCNQTGSNSTCASQSDISNFIMKNGMFSFRFYHINAMINPKNKTYLGYSINERNRFNIDLSQTKEATLYHSLYQITNEESILPLIHQKKVDQGFIVRSEQANVKSYRKLANEDVYARFYLRKDGKDVFVTRSNRTLTSILSYIGGLFSIITALFSFLNLYSLYCYEIHVGDKIFTQENGASFGADDFNFITFVGYFFYKFILRMFCCGWKWKQMEKYRKCQIQSQKQLNIDYIFQKINIFNSAIRVLFEKYQRNILRLTKKPTLSQAEKERMIQMRRQRIFEKLEQKAGVIYISDEEKQLHLRKYFECSDEVEDNSTVHHHSPMRSELINGYKQLLNGNDPLNRKIRQIFHLQKTAEVLNTIIRENDPTGRRIRNDMNNEDSIHSFALDFIREIVPEELNRSISQQENLSGQINNPN